jgi:hypothetical protein
MDGCMYMQTEYFLCFQGFLLRVVELRGAKRMGNDEWAVGVGLCMG